MAAVRTTKNRRRMLTGKNQAELDATRAQLADARGSKRVNKSMSRWKDQQTAAVARWRERLVPAPPLPRLLPRPPARRLPQPRLKLLRPRRGWAASVIKHGTHDPSSIASLLAENRELIAEAERHASQ